MIFSSIKNLLSHDGFMKYFRNTSWLFGEKILRMIAKYIVATELAKKCVVQISYAIGVAKPTSVAVDTYGTSIDGLNDDILSQFVMDNFSLTPNWITKKFNLDHPSEETFLYADVASRGQVGQSDYPWEKLDALEKFTALRN